MILMMRSSLFVLFSLILACNAVDKSVGEQLADPAPDRDRLSEKYEPNDEFFRQRAYPSGHFPIERYRQARRAVSDEMQQRGVDTAPWTEQGPGNIGARVNTLAAHPSDPNTLYAGFSGGGVWRTTDGTSSWQPIFDEQPFLSIGDIAVDPSNPETVYVGTGDVNISGFPSIGDGVWRSTDGGDSWTNIGLGDTYIISKIVVDPTDPNRIFVATMGKHWEPGPERGLYRTTDGGQTWEQVLNISDQAGVIDVLMHPDDPNLLIASGWDRIRTSEVSIVEGPGAKVFRSTDGGDSWTMLTDGLPQQDLGRTGLSWSPTDPNTVYVEYVGTDRQLFNIFRSTDLGLTWEPIITNFDGANGLDGGELGGFGWYFGKLRIVALGGQDLVLLLGVDLHGSIATLDNWSELTPPWFTYEVHADKHDLLQTSDGQIYLATDGGIYRTDNSFAEWTDVENIPTTQFYRIAHNPFDPTSYFGGAQDNGTTGGNADNIDFWPRIFGGDGFQPSFSPDDPNRFHVETQRGRLYLTEEGGDGFTNIMSTMDNDEPRNWDMPYVHDPTDFTSIYVGTDRLHYGIQPGPFSDYFWTPMSDFPLTYDDPDAQLTATVSTIAVSQQVPLLRYAGTSDGRVWRLDDSGIVSDVSEITGPLPDLYVTSVRTSPDISEIVYVTHSGYRDGIYTPRVHRSADRGTTWTDISGDLPDLPVNDLYVLPDHQDSVLIVATDGGVYATLNSGDEWTRVGNNMPNINVYDVDANPFTNELVAGTFGRSIMTYSLDSLLAQPSEPVSTREPVAVRSPEVRIFPNPSADVATIEFQNSEAGRAAHLVVLDDGGRVVYETKISGFGKQRHELSVERFVAGVYTVKIKTRHTIRSGRLVVSD